MDPIVLIFVAIAALCVGFLLGFITRYLLQDGTDTDKAKADPTPVVKKAPHKNWIEVANLWRDRRDGKLIFQIEKQYYKRGAELTIREREILLKIVMDFYRWLEPSSTIPTKSDQPAGPGVAAVGRPDQSSAGGMPPSEIRPQAHLREPVSPTTEVQPPAGVLTRALVSANVTVPETPLLSVVTQVNDILQEKIESAGMQKWAIRLTESSNKEMIVWVGMERYEWIDDVPYKRVRDIIHQSVAEWERRADAGGTGQ